MVAETGTSPGEAPQRAASAPAKGSRPERPTPATILLLAVWIGLTMGFLDLGFVVLQKLLIVGELYRLGHGFLWIIPTGVAALVVLPGAALALVAGLRLWRVPLGMAVGLTSFVGILDLCARLPLELWSSLLLSAGLAVQAARLVGPRHHGFLRFARRTAPLLGGVVLSLAVATSGVLAWTERRAITALPPPPAARNVLLIVWDTVRARNLSLYGHGRRTTPNLERLAARGTRFEHAFATSSWTLPSHASLFTGGWPHELSVGWKVPLDDAHPTLAGRLGSLGYDTAGFVANLDYCGREGGLARGFVHYEDYPLGVWDVFTRYLGLGRRFDPVSLAMVAQILTAGRRGPAHPLTPLSKEHAKRAEDVNQAFLNWLSWQRTRGRPFFAFLNYNDAHTPYEVPDDSAPGFGIRPSTWHQRLVLLEWNALDKVKLPFLEVQMANDIYDDCIAYLDRQLGTLLDELDRRGVLDDTLVVVTSDHGEHLGDHLLFFHGCSLYRQLVEVPLVVVDPVRVPAGRTVEEPVSLRDLPATVLDLLGLAGGSEFPGRTLARYWDPGNGRDKAIFEPVLMETEKPDLLTNQGREPVAKGSMRSLVAGGMHYIRSGDGGEELYALKADPAEETNLSSLPGAEVSLEGFRDALRSMFQRRSPNAALAPGSVEGPSTENERTVTLPTKAKPGGRPG